MGIMCASRRVSVCIFREWHLHHSGFEFPSYHPVIFNCSIIHSYHVISIYIVKHPFTDSVQLCSLIYTRAWLESHCDFLNHRLLAVFCPDFAVPLSALHPCFHLFAGFSLWIISVMHSILCREITWSLRGDVLWHTFPNHQSVCHSTSTSISSRLETTNVYCRHNRLQSPLKQDYTQMSCQTAIRSSKKGWSRAGDIYRRGKRERCL